LDLNITTALEADSFDWTQRQLEYSSVQLLAPAVGTDLQPSILEDANIIRDEAFPPLPALATQNKADGTGEPIHHIELQAQMAKPEAEKTDGPRIEMNMADFLDAPVALIAPEEALQPATKRQKMTHTPLLKGRVYGFDSITEVEEGTYSILRHYYGPADAAALLSPSVATFEHLGPLAHLIKELEKAESQSIAIPRIAGGGDADPADAPNGKGPQNMPVDPSQGELVVAPDAGPSGKLFGLSMVVTSDKTARTPLEFWSEHAYWEDPILA